MTVAQSEHRASTHSERLASVEGRCIHVFGTVQGVGFRPWVYRTARSHGVTGHVRNDATGVTIEAFGAADVLARFIDALHSPPPAARIVEIATGRIDGEAPASFEIVPSEGGPDPRVSIPPDLATCDACAAEIADPANRRYRYPFTNCTDCGPRFTIATGVPYDRSMTTMAPFEMCAECRREYIDPADRRFHAEPNACPVCGPRLTLHAYDGLRLDVTDPIGSAAQALALGMIVAVKGVGGFHLACDATSDAAVRLLRERKRRDEKPLAVMVRHVEEAASLGVVGPEERRLLTSVERPIVLLVKREGNGVAQSVAPRNQMIGVFLPYSPLHHLLLGEAARPLVMTSGNVSDEPIAFENDDAIGRLGGIADLFLLHDRAIQTRCDDSVVAVIAGRGAVMRRSRGYVPRSIEIPRAFSRPVLACGALLKNTFCIGTGTSAWLGPHVGDLENVETFDAFTDAIARMLQFLQVRPEIVAHDLHPDYLSSQYARRLPGVAAVPVQHHHAHVVSAMAEHGIDGAAIGIAYDGTGYGTDGTMWGGEVLAATPAAFTRMGTFRPLRLAGGDRAIHEPWRIALALVLDAYTGEIPADVRPLFASVPAREIELVTWLLRNGPAAPLARGVGRYFDGFGALFLGRTRATFEGQVALEWNQVAEPHVARTYRFRIETGTECDEIDLRPTLQDAVTDLVAGESPAAISAAFHNTLAEATAVVVHRVAVRLGALPIVASGGCFQNARLAESVRAALAPEHDVRLHQSVPPGDGGVALGQALIADAQVRG